MSKSAAVVIFALCLAQSVSAQQITNQSVSTSGNTVTLNLTFDAGWSGTWDTNCPYYGQTYPFWLSGIQYQVDGGPVNDAPNPSIQAQSSATECSDYNWPDNVYSIQFSYTDDEPGNHNVQVTLDYLDDGNDSGDVQTQFGYSISGGILIDGGNLQNSTNWNYCITSSCSPVAPPYGDFLWPFGQHISSPSTTGSSLESYQYGPPYWGILYYYAHYLNSQEVNTTNYQVQWQYYVDSSTYVQALEFDFPVIWNNQAFYFGSQCVQGANWQYWNINNGTWNDFSPEVPCTQTTAGTWHTLVWYGTRTSSQYTYQTLEIDGVQYTVSTTLNAPSNGTGIANDTITIQFQPDGNGLNPNYGYHEYIDNLQAWVW